MFGTVYKWQIGRILTKMLSLAWINDNYMTTIVPLGTDKEPLDLFLSSQKCLAYKNCEDTVKFVHLGTLL